MPLDRIYAALARAIAITFVDSRGGGMAILRNIPINLMETSSVFLLTVPALTGNFMKKIIQVHIYKGEQYYVAECIDLPVVTQGKTLDEVVANLKEAVELHLEGENLTDYDLVPQPTIIANLEIDSLVHA